MDKYSYLYRYKIMKMPIQNIHFVPEATQYRYHLVWLPKSGAMDSNNQTNKKSDSETNNNINNNFITFITIIIILVHGLEEKRLSQKKHRQFILIICIV